MKEGVPPKEPIDYKLGRLVSHLGCNPDSMRLLRKTESGKFFVILEAKRDGVSKIIKATADRRNADRLQVESNVLSSIPRDYLRNKGIVLPEIEEKLTQFENFSAIMISQVPEGEKPSFQDFCIVLDIFRKMKVEGLEIERVKPEDYLERTLTRLRFLRSRGFLKGVSSLETRRIQKFYEDNLGSLESFDMVFVHGDFKGKHVRRIDNELIGVLDFDKSVIGNELEDWAWLSVRHPWLGGRIIDYLKEDVFWGDKEKLENLDTAFRLMQIDRLIEGYFTRTYQWRGNLDVFSYISKTVGRGVLDLFLVRT